MTALPGKRRASADIGGSSFVSGHTNHHRDGSAAALKGTVVCFPSFFSTSCRQAHRGGSGAAGRVRALRRPR